MSKYNHIKILCENIDAIASRIYNKEYPYTISIPEHILHYLVEFIYDDIINLIIECFEECGLHITEKDFIDNMKEIMIKDRRDFIRNLSVRKHFINFIKEPINHFLYWSDTSFGWDVCDVANDFYREKIGKIAKINHLTSKI